MCRPFVTWANSVDGNFSKLLPRFADGLRTSSFFGRRMAAMHNRKVIDNQRNILYDKGTLAV